MEILKENYQEKEKEIFDSNTLIKGLNENNTLNDFVNSNDFILWENSSVSTGFISQEVTLLDSINNYDYVKYVYSLNISNDNFYSIYFNVNEYYPSSNATISCSANLYKRSFSFVNENTIYFGNAVQLNGTTINNNNVIPLGLYGVNINTSDCPVCPENPSGNVDLTKVESSLQISNELLVSANIGIISSFVGTVLFRVFRR